MGTVIASRILLTLGWWLGLIIECQTKTFAWAIKNRLIAQKLSQDLSIDEKVRLKHKARPCDQRLILGLV